MTKLDAGLITSLPASDPGSAAVWGSKRINPRPQSCLCLAWSGCPSNDDDDDDSSVYPVGNTTRHSHKLKKKISIKIPKVVSEYNKSMGRVDLLDKQFTLYRTRIRGKKWWFQIFTQMLDVAVVNCWRIHNIVNKNENLTLLETRRRLTLALLSKTSFSNRHRPGPQRSILRRGRVSEKVRYDSGNHFVAVIQTQRRCAQWKEGKKNLQSM